MNTPANQLTPGGQRFLRIVAITLIVCFSTIGGWAVWSQRQSRLHASARQTARLDPHGIESGVTPPNFDLPTDAQPTRMVVGMYVDRIVELSIKDTSWTVDFYLWFRWSGAEVLGDNIEKFQVVNGTIESSKLESEYENGEEHYQLHHVVAKISKGFDVSRFPCDDHLLTIDIEHPAFQRETLLYVADQANSHISSRVSVSAYAVREAGIIEKPHTYKSSRGDPRLAVNAVATHSQCRFGIGIHRTSWGYYFKMFEALFVAVAIAMLAMFIKPTNVDPRFGLGVGGLFAAVANMYVTSSLIPDTGVLTLADVVSALGIWTILLTVVQSIISLYLLEQREEVLLSRRFDRLCFVLFAANYLLLNLALPFAASG